MRSRRTTRVVSAALSVALHAVVLLLMFDWSVSQPNLPEPPPLPVRIIEPQARRPQAPKQPAPKPVAPPPPVAKAPEPPPPPAPPPPEPPPPPPPPQPENKIPLPEQQIVDQPDAGKEQAPPDTRLLSDRDNVVEKQMVKKGQPKPGDESIPDRAPPKQAKAPKPPKPQDRRGGGAKPPPPRVAALPGLDRLMPNALRLAEEGYGHPAEQPEAGADQPRRQQASAGGMWLPADGPLGTLDDLPDVPEGNITLLNTKAEIFAPFVRRVAMRVFQNFWISFKRDLAGSNQPAIEQVEAEAIMSPRGEMIGFEIKQRSARIALASDRRLQIACNDAFFDRNPPRGAEAPDGNIHFILRTEVQVGPSPRGWQGYVRFMAGLL